MTKREKKNTVPANPLKIEWPQDLHGATSGLRREGCRAIGRMDGKQDRLEIVVETLRILARHAETLLGVQIERKRMTAAKAVMNAAAAAELVKVAESRREVHLEKQIAGLGRRLAAIKESTG